MSTTQEERMRQHTEERVRHLRHPGQLSTINGQQVKREALRFVIGGDRYAYSVDDAVALLEERATRQECEKHGATYMAHHEDGSATCGRCYMQRAADLGMVKAPRKRTRFTYCAKHLGWFTDAGETRQRQAECFVEGGPADAEPCEGGRCELKPGTDFYVREFVEDNPVVTPADMGWANA